MQISWQYFSNIWKRSTINNNREQNALLLHNRKANSNFKNNWSCPSNMTNASYSLMLSKVSITRSQNKKKSACFWKYLAFEAMFGLSSQVVAHNVSEMHRRWIRCTWLQGSSNKHTHCRDFTFYLWFLQSLYSLHRKDNPSASKLTPIIFQEECVLMKKMLLQLLKKWKTVSTLSWQHSFDYAPALREGVWRCWGGVGKKRKRTGLKKCVVIVSYHIAC